MYTHTHTHTHTQTDTQTYTQIHIHVSVIIKYTNTHDCVREYVLRAGVLYGLCFVVCFSVSTYMRACVCACMFVRVPKCAPCDVYRHVDGLAVRKISNVHLIVSELRKDTTNLRYRFICQCLFMICTR